MGLLELKRKLLISPFWPPATLGCTFRNPSTFKATGLREPVILFPGKAMRPPTNPVGQEAVEGLKICPRRIGLLSHGFRIGLPAVSFRGGPNSAEKSPVRSASVGRVVMFDVPTLFRYCSQEKKKKVLSWPLYSLGIHTGPPTLPPKSF